MNNFNLNLMDKNDFKFEPIEDAYYLLKRWKNRKFNRFLDLGCGIGNHSIFFSKNDFKVSSVDYSDYLINDLDQYSKKEKLNIETKVIEFNTIPFAKNTFDCLIAYNSIYNTDKMGFEAMVNEIYRVLKPGGEAYITLVSKNTWKYKLDYNCMRIDSNTLLNTLNDCDKNTPRFYIDIFDIKRYFKEFEFIKSPVEITEYDIDNISYYCNFFKLLLKKS